MQRPETERCQTCGAPYCFMSGLPGEKEARLFCQSCHKIAPADVEQRVVKEVTAWQQRPDQLGQLVGPSPARQPMI